MVVACYLNKNLWKRMGTERVNEYITRIQELKNLPTLPIIATEILRIVREDRLSVNQMLPVIEKDPPLAMKILHIANSAYYGVRREIKSLRNAIVMLGLNEISRIALAFSVIRVLSPKDGEIDWRDLWRHSIACGYIAQIIAERVGLGIYDGLYSLGLLHDVGKIILYKVDSDNYLKVFEEIKNGSGEDCERKYFGLTHEEAGEIVANKWKLPVEFVTVIGHHHNVDGIDDEKLKDIAAIINIADFLTYLIDMNFASTETVESIEMLSGWKWLSAKFDFIRDLASESVKDEVRSNLLRVKELIMQEEI